MAHGKLERLLLLRFRQRTRDINVAEDARMRPSNVAIADLDPFRGRQGTYQITDLGILVLAAVGLG
jgi:hypothetical protein